MAEQADGISRRDFLSASAAMAAATPQTAAQPERKPNIIIIIADQVRADAIGAYGSNPMNLTPNLDAMAAEGTLYRNMFTNQPVCSPSRACLFTGEYPARHGVWRNTGRGVGIASDAATIATVCRDAGYSANYIGKWHLADGTRGPVPPRQRGGFLNLWEASNELELTSHPYEGDLWDADGRPMHFENEFRSDFITGLATRFLDNAGASPFLLVVSYLEPHQQNDLGHMVAPNGYATRYQNPFVPEDLKHLPGTWQQQLPDYYGCIKSIDECVGKIREALSKNRLDRNTIVCFISDHGCHFMTRNTEYKRSGHDASIRIPFIVTGPGFSGGNEIRELVSMVEVSPTLLDAVGLKVPGTMQGKSTVPLLKGERNQWRNEIFVQMSEFWVARALRTPEWTYVAAARRGPGRFQPAPNASRYYTFQIYNNRGDPHQLINLAGHRNVADADTHLRERLRERMQETGDAPAELLACEFPYP
jgi:arylsulfatase A-like enzyme